MNVAKRTRTRPNTRLSRAAEATKSKATTVDPAPALAPDAAGVAEYVAQMAAELASIAGAAKLDMLTYFLNMARIEAESYYRRRK
ncbi:MAG: hypothetical protein ACLPID_18585 [Beijerinckiaceae bacterium]